MRMQIKARATENINKNKTFKLSLVPLLGLDMGKVWLLIPALIFGIAIHVLLAPPPNPRGEVWQRRSVRGKSPLTSAFLTHTQRLGRSLTPGLIREARTQ